MNRPCMSRWVASASAARTSAAQRPEMHGQTGEVQAGALLGARATLGPCPAARWHQAQTGMSPRHLSIHAVLAPRVCACKGAQRPRLYEGRPGLAHTPPRPRHRALLHCLLGQEIPCRAKSRSGASQVPVETTHARSVHQNARVSHENQPHAVPPACIAHL